MLLNKYPVLDKGFVARIDSSGGSTKLNEIAIEYYKVIDGKFLTDLSSLTLLIKCPLFVQLNLSLFGFKIVTIPSQDELMAYEPNVSEVGAKSLELSKAISADMKQTSDALLINPKAYQSDGCDRFISQILTPINTYTSVIVYGMYNDWCRYIRQKGVPYSMASYINAVDQLMKAEWR